MADIFIQKLFQAVVKRYELRWNEYANSAPENPKEQINRYRKLKQEQIKVIAQLWDTNELDDLAVTQSFIDLMKRHELLRRADLSGLSLKRVNLSNANLEGINLFLADLQYANLEGARLCDAVIGFASFNEANLAAANFQNADLRETQMGKANLQAADFRGADLRKANLFAADVRGTNFYLANLQYAWFDSSLQIDSSTILPNGRNWTTDTNLLQFTEG